jgi:hypothetical protein
MANNLSINTHRNESIIYIHDQTPTPSPNPIKATVELQRHQSDSGSRQLSLSQIQQNEVSIASVSISASPQPLVPKPKSRSRFWKMLILSIILGLVMGFIIWELNVETQLRSDSKSHEVSTREQLLNETTLACGKLYQIGYKTNPGIVLTRDLTFDCPSTDVVVMFIQINGL